MYPFKKIWRNFYEDRNKIEEMEKEKRKLQHTLRVLENMKKEFRQLNDK